MGLEGNERKLEKGRREREKGRLNNRERKVIDVSEKEKEIFAQLGKCLRT